MVRGKNPAVDLRRKYRKTFMICLALSIALHGAAALKYPRFQVEAYSPPKQQIVIKVEDIPETRQVSRPPPPPRPSVPIEVESEEIPDDVTIVSTELDFDKPLDMVVPPPFDALAGPPAEQEGPLVLLELEPRPIKMVTPKYPEEARKAGLEGVVVLKLLVGEDGKVEEVVVVSGPEVFRPAAMEAAKQSVYRLVLQGDQSVRAWISKTFRFSL